MALDFDSASSTRRVAYGNPSSLTDLPYAGNKSLTVWQWIMRTSNGDNQHLVTKDASSPRGWLFLVTNSPAEGCLRVVVVRASSNTSYISSSGAGNVVALNTPTFAAFTHYDNGATITTHIYLGTQTTPAAEVSYNSSNAGSGAGSDNGADLYVGNLQRANTNPFRGKVYRGGILNVELSLAQLQKLQFASLNECNIIGTKLLYDYQGTGTQQDFSGNGNSGTVTGATHADHIPLIYSR